MSSGLRSRSVSRTRFVRKTDLFESGESLDPYLLLDDLLKNLKDTQAPLSVKISDGTRSVTYLLSTFLMKEYEIINGKVKFGIISLDIDSLRVNISFDIVVTDEQ